MRRVLIVAACGLVAIGAAAALAWLARTHLSPQALRERLEMQLARALGTEAQLGPVGVSFDRDGFALAAPGLRAFPSERGDALAAERIEVQVDLWALLLGEIRLRGIDLESPTLRLRRSGRGFAVDADPPPAGGGPAPERAPGVAWYEALAARLPHLQISGGRLLLREGAGDRRDIEIEGLVASFERQWLRGGVGVAAQGELRVAGSPEGRFALRGVAAERSDWTLRIDRLALSPVAALAGGSIGKLALRGRASGELRVEVGPRGIHAVDVDLRAPKLHLEPPFRGARMALDPAAVRLAASASAGPKHWSLTGELGVGTLGIPFDANVGGDGVERVRLRAVDLAALSPLADAVPELERTRARGALESLRGGWLEALELRFTTPEPGESAGIAASWRVANASVDAGSAGRLTGLSGEGSYDGDVLELRGVRSELEGQPLPKLDVRLAGLSHVAGFSKLRCNAPAPASALPGLRPLADWANGDDTEPRRPPSWRRLRLTAYWIEHPALLCAVEALTGEVAPDPETGGVTVSVAHAVWAGIPLRGEAHYRALPDADARVLVEIGPPRPPTPADAERAGWAGGRYEFETPSLGIWKTRGAAGAFLASGAHLRLEETSLRLDPGPELRGVVDLDLSAADRVPFELQAQISRGQLSDLYASSGWSNAATGALAGSASLRGALRPGSPMLGDSQGGFSLHARDGVIRQKFRLLLAVTMASETLNPFRDRGTIRYTAMDVDGEVKDGAFVIDAFSIDGPALRAAASGRIAATGTHQTELVMGLYFFRTIDSVLGRVPIVNRIMLGEDANLIGAYVAMTGPWESLGARVIPVKTLMKGPVGFVFEGLPSFVRGSLRRVQAMLPAAGGDSDDDAKEGS